MPRTEHLRTVRTGTLEAACPHHGDDAVRGSGRPRPYWGFGLFEDGLCAHQLRPTMAGHLGGMVESVRAERNVPDATAA